MIEEKVAKKLINVGPFYRLARETLSLSLSLSIPIYYITESDNRRKQTQKDKKKEAKANKHDFDHVSMVYSSSSTPLPSRPHTHQCTIHWKPIMSQLWMNKRTHMGFHLRKLSYNHPTSITSHTS
jgi:hypothetical protein